MLRISNRVGPGCANRQDDVRAVHAKLVAIRKISPSACTGVFNADIHNGIVSVQRHFTAHPDGIIDVNGLTHRMLNTWKTKPVSPGAVLSGRLKAAWELVNPLLPDGSYCASGLRTVDDQRRILHQYFKESLKADIIAKYGQRKYDEVSADLLKHETQVVDMVRGAGQAIATPGRSQHQHGRAIDVGGPSRIDAEQVRIIRMVARANPSLLTGYVLRERNGCVHFEIK